MSRILDKEVNGFRLSSFSEICTINQGLQIPIEKRHLNPGENRYFYITNQFLKDGAKECYYIENPLQSVVCNEDDILMTRTGNTGIVVTGVKGVFHNNFFKINYDKSKIVREFLVQYLRSDKIQKQIMKVASSTTIPDLKHSDFYNIKCILPSLKEQEKIAEILSTWDLAIEKQEQLIEKKKEFKKGLMQRLLCGKVRFKEFNEQWVTVKLGDIFKERKETGFENLELLAITTANGVVRRTDIDIKDTSSEDKSKYKRILPGDIGYNTMRMWQGVSGLSRYEGIVSPAYTILRPVKDIDSIYMAYLFKLPNIINLFYRYSQGLVSDTLNLKYENFKNIKVNIPRNIKEQNKIAKVLMQADKEIELLQKELEALKLQKKGLMQRLLTGEVRVKV